MRRILALSFWPRWSRSRRCLPAAKISISTSSDFLGLNKKKPLPGERDSRVPERRAGRHQGIPPEYQKSYVEQQQQAGMRRLPQRCQQEEAAKAAAGGGKEDRRNGSLRKSRSRNRNPSAKPRASPSRRRK